MFKLKMNHHFQHLKTQEKSQEEVIVSNKRIFNVELQLKVKLRVIKIAFLLLFMMVLAVMYLWIDIQQTSKKDTSQIKEEYPDSEALQQEFIQHTIQQSKVTNQIMANETLNQQQKTDKDNEKIRFASRYEQNLKNNFALSSYLKKEIVMFKNHLSPYLKMNQPQLATQMKTSNITRLQFMNALQLLSYAPLITTNNEKIVGILKKEYNYYSNKYHIQQYRQLPFCIIVPTYQNIKKYRYFMNLYTILQQQYANYHVIIIDDASGDGTAQKIQAQINKDEVIKRKVKLIKNGKRKYHMQNIHYAINNHCQRGEIFFIVDGDDELIGTQVFKLFNAVYHQKQSFAIYSNHIQNKKDRLLELGISRQYPAEIIKSNTYRDARHYYSHLKSAWTDLFYIIFQESLKDSKGMWYNNAVDNAIFLSIFEMACQRIQYLPQITYKYNTFTGNNVDNMDYQLRTDTANQIKNKTKYKCIKQQHPDIYRQILSYFQ